MEKNYVLKDKINKKNNIVQIFKIKNAFMFMQTTNFIIIIR